MWYHDAVLRRIFTVASMLPLLLCVAAISTKDFSSTYTVGIAHYVNLPKVPREDGWGLILPLWLSAIITMGMPVLLTIRFARRRREKRDKAK